MLAQIVDGVRAHDEITVTWPVAFRDAEGVTYAEFDKVIYVARKDFYQAKMRARAAARASHAVTALALVACGLLGTSKAHAADEIPFAAKLARQQALGQELIHAWRAGDVVRAPVFVTCDDRLTLTVDAFAPGGAGRFENVDRFRVEPPLPEDFERWRGRGFEAVLEILGVEPNRGLGEIGNVQTYRARLRNIAPSNDVLNPGRFMTKDLPVDAVVRLRGEVRKVGAREIVLRTEFYEFTVQLGQVRARLDGDLLGEIETPVRNEPVELGDVVGVHALVTSAHDLMIYPGRPTWLISPGPARRARYLEERRINEALFRTHAEHARAGEWSAARMAIGELQRRTLTPGETTRLASIFARTPGFARPVRIGPHARALVALVDHTFDIDVEEMTAGELTAFADAWARQRVRGRTPDEWSRHDETLIYRALEKVGVPPGDVADVARRAIRQRVRWLDLRARTGVRPDELSRRELGVIEGSLAVLARAPNAVNVRFVVNTTAEVARRAGYDHVIGTRLVPALAVTLARMLDDFPDAEADLAYASLRRAAPTVRRLATHFTGTPAGAPLARVATYLEAI
jgi:hypothetical protein